VRDVLAHLVDGTMRRLSFDRDRMPPPPPPRPIENERALVEYINDLNREWVRLARRYSARVLTDLYDSLSRDLATFFEQVPLDGPALFGVSWAGEMNSLAWFDIGREFTEHWHHQAQIRDAAGAPAASNPAWLHAVLAIAMRGLPHAYRDVVAAEGSTLVVDVTGPSGGVWMLRRDGDRWILIEGGAAEGATARAAMSDDTAWRLLFNGLTGHDAALRLEFTGEAGLATPLLGARSVIV
jgi:hypothetical protein